MTTDFNLPELGEDIETGDVVALLVSVGDTIEVDQPVLEIETDKAAIEIPSSVSGVITAIHVEEGGIIEIGKPILTVDTEGTSGETATRPKTPEKTAPVPKPESPPVQVKRQEEPPAVAASKTRPTTETAEPLPNFSRWGEIERSAMGGVRRATAKHMATAWETIPHVTNYDKADITELERLRKQYAARIEAGGGKLTITAILLKIVAGALKQSPQFCASIDIEKEEIIYKKYYHIGVAVDTLQGLLVPVIRDVDQKNIIELAIELNQASEKARNRKLGLEEMQGGTFTISNLGGIGGTNFAPIINAPEVGILGVSRSQIEPVFIDDQFQPRVMLPLALSYDHRLIDGADAARFLRRLVEALENPFLLALEG
jgi:pyruvate dehydrogenase E2 component (dihydrolipoamide acetyltransferase)